MWESCSLSLSQINPPPLATHPPPPPIPNKRPHANAYVVIVEVAASEMPAVVLRVVRAAWQFGGGGGRGRVNESTGSEWVRVGELRVSVRQFPMCTRVKFGTRVVLMRCLCDCHVQCHACVCCRVAVCVRSVPAWKFRRTWCCAFSVSSLLFECSPCSPETSSPRWRGRRRS